MNRTLRVVVPAVAVVALAGCGRSGDEPVAVFNGGEVKAEEFRLRYQTYLEKVSQRDNILLRKQILNNMVSERLMVLDLREKGFEDRPEARERFEQIRLQAIVDKYARRISSDTISVTEAELRDEFRAYNSRASARYLYARTEDGAWKIKEQLKRGASFDDLARTVFDDPGLANNGGYLGSFGWGDLEPSLEEVAFFQPLGEVSDPVPLRVGYGIVKVETRAAKPLASGSDYAKVKEKLSRAVLERKTARLLRDVTRNISRAMSPVFDEGAIRIVLDHWLDIAGQTNPEIPMTADVSDHHLVSFARGSWTLGEFFEKVRRTSERQRNRVHDTQDVRDVVTGLIVREELLSGALAEQLEDDAGVLAQREAVSLRYRLDAWREMVEDTVGQSGWNESVLREDYAKNREQYVIPPQVNVAEILVRTSAEAQAMLTRLKEGADFSDLARQHSIRLWAGKQGGELGFGTKSDFGILGEKFFSTTIGEIIGPEYVDPYYGVFKVVGRREGREKTFEEARVEIVQARVNLGKQESFRKALEDLRVPTNIQVDLDVLANIVLDNQAKGQAL